MKLTKKIGPVLLTILFVGALAGCSGLLGWIMPLTIEERIAAFTLIINDEDRSADTILLNFGPEDDMLYYDTAKTDSFWDAAFPADNDYLFTVIDDTYTDAVLVGGTITTSSGGTLITSYLFKMYEEASGNWLISAIYEDPEGTNEDLIRKVDF